MDSGRLLGLAFVMKFSVYSQILLVDAGASQKKHFEENQHHTTSCAIPFPPHAPHDIVLGLIGKGLPPGNQDLRWPWKLGDDVGVLSEIPRTETLS